MTKFVAFEKVSEMVYQRVDKSKTSSGMQTTINLGSGLMAGFAAALISQPADTMLSKINKTKGLPGEGTTSRLIKIARELGLRGSFSGIGARLFMVGTLTAGEQFWCNTLSRPSVNRLYLQDNLQSTAISKKHSVSGVLQDLPGHAN